MCGNHDSSGAPIGHSHGHEHHGDPGHGRQSHEHRSVRPLLRSRRAFLGELGAGTLAMAVFTPTVLAACGEDSPATTTAAAPSPTATGAPSPASTAAPDPTAAPESLAADEAPTSGAVATADMEPLQWARANLGFVSAYVLARGNKAAIVDTGVAGSANRIGEVLGELGLNYADVDHVILTHKHADHAGSIAEVLGQAVNATVYAGEADLAEIDTSPITPLLGGEDVFGFEMLSTPGHTDSHMAAIDQQAGLLIAGDAIFSEGGLAVEGPARFFTDVAQSRDTIRQLASLSFNTLLMGHGEPIEGGADAAVSALAASF